MFTDGFDWLGGLSIIIIDKGQLLVVVAIKNKCTDVTKKMWFLKTVAICPLPLSDYCQARDRSKNIDLGSA